MQYEDTKVAFVGASTPESLTTSTPTFFQNEKGKYIYSFCEDKTGNKMYKQLQKNVDKARKDGADYVFIVGHLGMDGTTPQWSSESVAKNTQGVDLLSTDTLTSVSPVWLKIKLARTCCWRKQALS